MPEPFSILALDLHNTIYDEVMEYGLAIEEAVVFFIDLAKQCGVTLTSASLHKELAAAHKELGSDWDDEVWQRLPSLKGLPLSASELATAIRQAEARRGQKSRELMMEGLYQGVRETLASLRRRGVRIFVVTEAAGDMAMLAASWLELAGLVDGIYSYPSHKTPLALQGIYHEAFPDAPGGGHLKKPHPYLLAKIALTESIRRHAIPEGTQMQDVFALIENDFLIPELAGSPAPRLEVKDSLHAAVLRNILDAMLYVGDSKFKDGMLAWNAGVAFGFAAYGKKIKHGNEARHQRSLGIMYAVTGWEVDTLKLTQESARSEVIDRLKPDYTFENSLSEALELFI